MQPSGTPPRLPSALAAFRSPDRRSGGDQRPGPGHAEPRATPDGGAKTWQTHQQLVGTSRARLGSDLRDAPDAIGRQSPWSPSLAQRMPLGGASPASPGTPDLAAVRQWAVNQALDQVIAGQSPAARGAECIARALRAHLGPPASADLAALVESLAQRRPLLTTTSLMTLATALASAVRPEAQAPLRVLQQLLEAWVVPLQPVLGPTLTASLVLGLQRAYCGSDGQPEAQPAPCRRAARALRQWVEAQPRSLDADARALLFCALALGPGTRREVVVPGGADRKHSPARPPQPAPAGPRPAVARALFPLAEPSPARSAGGRTCRVVAGGPPALGRLLAREPMALLAADQPSGPRRQALIEAALALMAAGNPSCLHEQFNALCDQPPTPVLLDALGAVLAQGRARLGPGIWSLHRFRDETLQAWRDRVLVRAARLCDERTASLHGQAEAWLATRGEISAAETLGLGASAREEEHLGVARQTEVGESMAVREAVQSVLDELASFDQAACLSRPARAQGLRPSARQRPFLGELVDWLAQREAQALQRQGGLSPWPHGLLARETRRVLLDLLAA